MLPGDNIEVSMGLKLPFSELKRREVGLHYSAKYAIPDGHYVGDEASVRLRWERGPRDFGSYIDYHGKRYFHGSGLRFKSIDEP
jgi:hypothetical protein